LNRLDTAERVRLRGLVEPGPAVLFPPISVRVSSQSYITALLLGSFFSGLFFYLELDPAGIVLFSISWILIPALALNDRISFDGKRIFRTGLLPKIWSSLNSSRRSLKVSDIEQVETHANRSVRRGANILYRYKTIVRGKGVSISIASGGDAFRDLVKCILLLLPENALDNRSIELRDHLADPKETLMKAEFSRIPAADVLESSLRHSDLRGKAPHLLAEQPPEEEKAEDLRTLGNELRLSGYLLPAIEAFRRALVLKPTDGRLLFDFARCLYSVAGIERDRQLERRALAALRLSERRAVGDGELMIRLGEWYFQIGEWRRAGNLFTSALDRFGEDFRTARGLAEIALRDGKIAHVIHHFSAANRLAETPALRRWSRNEADYFSNLHSNDEYMEMEIGRVSLLESVEGAKRTTLRITFLGFPAILVGMMLSDTLVANIGWAVSSVCLLIWTGLVITTHMLSQRFPFEVVDTED
jgi:tetratricopeptide (TPR) repeat protein